MTRTVRPTHIPGMELRRYLDDRKLSCTAFGQMVGVTPSTVSRWVAGRLMPRPAQIRKIMHVTEGAVTADDLLGAIDARQEAA